MQKKGKTGEPLVNWATNLEEAISARTYLQRERIIWWVLSPIVVLCVAVSMALVVLDAFRMIPPMRQGLLWIIGGILGGGVLGFVVTAGFGWLFKTES